MAVYKDKKTEHAFQRFQKDIKEDMSGLVVFTGEEEYLISWAKGMLIDRFTDEITRTLDLDVIEDDDYDMDRIIAGCETLPMMSEKRVVVLRDYGKPDLKAIGEYADSIPETSILLLIVTGTGRYLKGKGRQYEFGPLERSQLVSFISKRFREKGKTAEKSMITAIIEESGYYNRDIDYTLANLVGDIEKIAALASGDTVALEDIRTGISDNLEHGVFTMIDEISRGRKDRAFSLLHQIVTSGEDEIRLLALIISQLEIMLQTKELMENGWQVQSIAKKIKIHEFRVKKAANYCRRFTAGELEHALKEAFDADIKIKRGILDGRLALEMLIAGI